MSRQSHTAWPSLLGGGVGCLRDRARATTTDCSAHRDTPLFGPQGIGTDGAQRALTRLAS